MTDANSRRPPITKPTPAYERPVTADRAPPKRRARSRPIRPNAGLEALYRKRMTALVDEMAASVEHWVAAAYRANEPRALAIDEAPADALMRAVRSLAKRWLGRFEAAAPRLADWFAQSARNRSDEALRRILREGGFTVRFKLTAAQRDVMKATVAQNITLIKSIPAQYFDQIEQSVMRSVQVGRDLGGLTKELREHFGVTKRRASFIARSQNNMATAVLARTRQTEVGITHCMWIHSGGGREPRASHVKAGREKIVYAVSEGWYDPNEKKYILPGELPNCRCVSRPLIKGFS